MRACPKLKGRHHTIAPTNRGTERGLSGIETQWCSIDDQRWSMDGPPRSVRDISDFFHKKNRFPSFNLTDFSLFCGKQISLIRLSNNVFQLIWSNIHARELCFITVTGEGQCFWFIFSGKHFLKIVWETMIGSKAEISLGHFLSIF